MASKYEATRDTSRLVEATGYWSGNPVYFNPDRDNIVIIDQKLQVSNLQRLIHEYLEINLEDDILLRLKESHARSGRGFSDFIRGRYLRSWYSITKSATFDRPEFKRGQAISWSAIANWLTATHACVDTQHATLARLLANAVLSNPETTRHDKRHTGLHVLTNPWLRETLDAWEASNTSLEEALSMLCDLAFHEKIKIPPGVSPQQFEERAGAVLHKLRDKGACIPALTTKSTILTLGTLSNAACLLLGLLRMGKRIVLPGNTEVTRVLSVYAQSGPWSAALEQHDDLGRRTFILRLLASSTLDTIADTPGNLAQLCRYIPGSSYLNRTLAPTLEAFSKEHNLPAFPVPSLNGLKSRRNAGAKAYTVEWLEERGVPPKWISFAKHVHAASNIVQKGTCDQLRAVIEWAWFEHRFACPSDVHPTDLRDPHKPDRNDTLYQFICRKDVSEKSALWSRAQQAFQTAHNQDKLSQLATPLVPSNPFADLRNPFKGRKRNTTHRRRIPTNQHEAMIQVLLSPDKDGNPTFSFVKETLGWDWFDWTNPATGEIERVWCPSRARCLAFLLMLPPRGKQARWLDQGLLDQKVWDVDTEQYLANTHPLKNWRHPATGKNHLEIYGRPSGVLQPIHDDWHNQDQLCLFINTNKTQMWDPERVTGYEIWWPRGDQLREWDIANLAQQADYLDRPYRLIEDQIRWLQQFDPDPVPVSFIDSSEDADNVNKDQQDNYPYFTPVFRDPSSPYHREDGTQYFLPVTKGRLDRLFTALAVHTEERLREQGLDVVLTLPAGNSGNHVYRGRKHRYDLHSLRVYGVSYLMELGVPLPIVQMIVGHEGPAMTLSYNKPSPDYVRRVLAGKISGAEILGDWDDIGADLLKHQRQFIATNSNLGASDIPSDLLDHDYTGFTQKPGGMCPLGGTACNIGQATEAVVSNNKIRTTYGPVSGGCGNCRFFCTTPAHLFQHQMVINDLMIRIRSTGKQQTALAERLSELSWQEGRDSAITQEVADIQSQIEEIERQIEPLIREWMNRSQMATRTIEHLDDFLEFLGKRGESGHALLLLSASTAEDMAPEIEVRMEKTGEFELARQTLLAAHLQGGIEQCPELPRTQVREFMDRIMIHDDPTHLLLQIPDERTRDKVAFLMAEAMASIAGPTAVQKALDENVGLKALSLNENQQLDLKTWVTGLFNNAKRQGRKATLTSLMPPSLRLIDGDKEINDEL